MQTYRLQTFYALEWQTITSGFLRDVEHALDNYLHTRAAHGERLRIVAKNGTVHESIIA